MKISSSTNLKRVVLSCLLALGAPFAQAQTGRLNDTGQTSCYDAANAVATCNTATTGNAGTRPHQDGRYGRDAAQAAGQLPAKTGAGAAGFDFTKIANNGTAQAGGATLGSNPTDWACTRDSTTGLVWEVKTTSGRGQPGSHYHENGSAGMKKASANGQRAVEGAEIGLQTRCKRLKLSPFDKSIDNSRLSGCCADLPLQLA